MAHVMDVFSLDACLSGISAPSSLVPVDSEMVHDSNSLAGEHLGHSLTLGLGHVLNYSCTEMIPEIPVRQPVEIDCPYQLMSTHKDQIEYLSDDVFENWAQDGVMMHNEGSKLIGDQILGLLKRAENLYEYGIMMRLFPSGSNIPKLLADAQSQIQSTSTRKQSMK
ncbi:hypothetical protein BJX66DRAFT_343654 [Aspergillus keveii]|uniref:Uncharacterized protein n=1 Tax=Aspergillus keveii TaxID=714993 RepID=A0ABR4FNH9_9EURO